MDMNMDTNMDMYMDTDMGTNMDIDVRYHGGGRRK